MAMGFNQIFSVNYLFKRLMVKSLQAAIFPSFRVNGGRTYCEIARFPGATAKYTQKLSLIKPDLNDKIPVYRVMDNSGNIIDKDSEPAMSEETLLKWYKTMTLLNSMDRIMFESQRQGRISFYMTSYGEEGTHIGSCAALDAGDMIYGQYRETGVLLYRGFSLKEVMSQCFSTEDDLGRGRQMPVHYGSKKLNFSTISSPLGTQMPQAAGTAYAFKQLRNDKIVVCYFGEGAASEGDAHGAFNFAATLNCPVIFFCRNNGYAISTPAAEQYKGDGIASRAAGYGIATIRVDGNDVLAVYNATKMAREYCLKEMAPVIVEALCYRVGQHSTSDDSSAYRSVDEVSFWENNLDPIGRFQKYLVNKNLWSKEQDSDLLSDCKKKVIQAFHAAERRKLPPVDCMMTDVYRGEVPRSIQRQTAALKDHLNSYGKHYPMDQYREVK